MTSTAKTSSTCAPRTIEKLAAPRSPIWFAPGSRTFRKARSRPRGGSHGSCSTRERLASLFRVLFAAQPPPIKISCFGNGARVALTKFPFTIRAVGYPRISSRGNSVVGLLTTKERMTGIAFRKEAYVKLPATSARTSIARVVSEFPIVFEAIISMAAPEAKGR